METRRDDARTPFASLPPLPAGLRAPVVAAAAALLTLFFFVIGFPWERLADGVALRAGDALGAEVAIASLGVRVLPLPALEASGVRMRWPDGRAFDLERLRVRPAVSLSWLRGRPAIFVDGTGPLGRARGTLTAGDAPGFDGRLENVSLASLPIASVAPGFSLDGTVDADVALAAAPDGPHGTLRLAARDGSIAAPGLPLALPFATLDADLALGDAPRADVRSLRLDGPMLTATARGTLGAGPIAGLAPLDLALEVTVKDPSLRPAAAAAGLRLDAAGKASLHVTGTPEHPDVR